MAVDHAAAREAMLRPGKPSPPPLPPPTPLPPLPHGPILTSDAECKDSSGAPGRARPAAPRGRAMHRARPRPATEGDLRPANRMAGSRTRPRTSDRYLELSSR